MNFDDLTRQYFGDDDIDALPYPAVEAGIERMRVDLGLEGDKARRFILWSFLYMLDAAPEVTVAFEDPVDRDAARNFMDLIEVDAGPDS